MLCAAAGRHWRTTTRHRLGRGHRGVHSNVELSIPLIHHEAVENLQNLRFRVNNSFRTIGAILSSTAYSPQISQSFPSCQSVSPPLRDARGRAFGARLPACPALRARPNPDLHACDHERKRSRRRHMTMPVAFRPLDLADRARPARRAELDDRHAPIRSRLSPCPRAPEARRRGARGRV